MLEISSFHVPCCAAVDTFHANIVLTGSPLVKAGLVHVIATCRFAPHQLIVVLVEIHVTDGTFTFDWLSLAIGVSGTGKVGRYSWRCSKDISQFRGEKSKLVLQMLGGLENIVQDVNLVFAFVSFPVIRTAA